MGQLIERKFIRLLHSCLLSVFVQRTFSRDASSSKAGQVQYQSPPAVGGVVRDIQVGPSGDVYFSAWLPVDAMDIPTAFVGKISPELDLVWKKVLTTRGQPHAAPSLTLSPDGRIYALQSSNGSFEKSNPSNLSILELYQIDPSNGELALLFNTTIPGLTPGAAAICLHSRHSTNFLYLGIPSTRRIFLSPVSGQDVSGIVAWKINVTRFPATEVWKVNTTPAEFSAHSFAIDESVSDGSLSVTEIVSPVDDISETRYLQVSSISSSGSGIRQGMIPADSSSSWISAAVVDGFGNIVVSERPGMLHHIRLTTPAGPASRYMPSNITIDWTLSSTDQVSSIDIARKSSLSFQWIYAVGMARGVLGANEQPSGANLGEPDEVPFVAIYNSSGGIVLREVLTPTPGTNQTLTSVLITNVSTGNAMAAGYLEQTGTELFPQLLLLRYQLPDALIQGHNSTSSPTPRPLTIGTPSPLPETQSRNKSLAVALIASFATALAIVASLGAFLILSRLRSQKHSQDNRKDTIDRGMQDSPASNALARETFT
jgi:hypothetical protein